MYGLDGQDRTTIRQDIGLISRLRPQQVTLYELRPNMISKMQNFSKEALFDQYSQYYDGLIAMGYMARFGQNTYKSGRGGVKIAFFVAPKCLKHKRCSTSIRP